MSETEKPTEAPIKPVPKAAKPTEAPIKSVPQGGELWKILRGGSPQAKCIARGDYDEVLRELYDMAVRHEQAMIETCATRLTDLGIEIPQDETPLTPKDPKPWAGLVPRAGRRRG